MKDKIFFVATLAAAIAACSSTPDQNLALDQAKTQFDAAQGNPQVRSLAADELDRAEKSLRAAQHAWQGEQPVPTVNHLAYMTSKNVLIAQETASSMGYQAVTENASAERDSLLLQVRTDQADQAEGRLAKSRSDNQRSTEALGTARQEAELAAQRQEARIEELQGELEALDAKKSARGMVVTLGDMLFDTGKFDILSSATPNISKLAVFLVKYPEQHASVEGHTDSTGSTMGNQRLSQQRASAVKAALVDMGVSSNNLSTQAHGSENPVADNATVSGRKANRRVEIVFAQPTEALSSRE